MLPVDRFVLEQMLLPCILAIIAYALIWALRAHPLAPAILNVLSVVVIAQGIRVFCALY